MKAKKLLLTHITQKFPFFPITDALRPMKIKDLEVVVAFDLMKVRLDDFHKGVHMVKPLQKFFAQQEDEV